MAALPWRLNDSAVEILMVTTRTTGRWVIPKGWPMPGRADHDAAAVEALEEAGVTGQVTSQAFGQFNYLKLFENGKTKGIRVTVYPLEVKRELATWQEMGQRERRWMTPQEAIAVTGETELVGILLAFSEAYGDREARIAKTRTAQRSEAERIHQSTVLETISARIRNWFGS